MQCTFFVKQNGVLDGWIGLRVEHCAADLLHAVGLGGKNIMRNNRKIKKTEGDSWEGCPYNHEVHERKVKELGPGNDYNYHKSRLERCYDWQWEQTKAKRGKYRRAQISI